MHRSGTCADGALHVPHVPAWRFTRCLEALIRRRSNASPTTLLLQEPRTGRFLSSRSASGTELRGWRLRAA